jgi:hypothetical protein
VIELLDLHLDNIDSIYYTTAALAFFKRIPMQDLLIINCHSDVRNPTAIGSLDARKKAIKIIIISFTNIIGIK